ncbi:MAG: class I SAM-dependent methyltransferase [Crocinitomicaceae bacterium]|nr:class I SAM-dependent methyltransferase [Crocinitomicaceae bacterium]MDG1777449.1 class I SAM-dependent methyltransferase [Crocinitomicaceae bacterium]
MEEFNRKSHWENIYTTKALNEVSWYQEKPETSISFLNSVSIRKDAAIIDVGGGDSFFVDYLLQEGFTNVTVLDISEAAIKRAKLRLGEQASKVSWVVSDVTKFTPTMKFDFWHDRAAFHFLTDLTEIKRYKETVYNSMSLNGDVVIGTFSKTGPLKCSGIEITQYAQSDLIQLFSDFKFISGVDLVHNTPFDTTQNFVFCHFKNG